MLLRIVKDFGNPIFYLTEGRFLNFIDILSYRFKIEQKTYSLFVTKSYLVFSFLSDSFLGFLISKTFEQNFITLLGIM